MLHESVTGLSVAKSWAALLGWDLACGRGLGLEIVLRCCWCCLPVPLLQVSPLSRGRCSLPRHTPPARTCLQTRAQRVPVV